MLSVLVFFTVIAGTVLITFFVSRAAVAYFESRKKEVANIATINNTKIDESIEILKLEFEYAKSSSFQAEKDRLAIVNFYLGLFGIVTPVVFGLREVIDTNLNIVGAIILLVIAFIGVIFVLQLVRLRQAWIESAKAMGRIKDYFIEQNKSISNYLIWQSQTIPKPQKFKTISFFSSITIICLGTVSLVLALTLLGLTSLFIALIALLYMISLFFTYYFMLVYNF